MFENFSRRTLRIPSKRRFLSSAPALAQILWKVILATKYFAQNYDCADSWEVQSARRWLSSATALAEILWKVKRATPYFVQNNYCDDSWEFQSTRCWLSSARALAEILKSQLCDDFVKWVDLFACVMGTVPLQWVRSTGLRALHLLVAPVAPQAQNSAKNQFATKWPVQQRGRKKTRIVQFFGTQNRCWGSEWPNSQSDCTQIQIIDLFLCWQ